MSGGRRLKQRGQRAYEKSRYAIETIMGDTNSINRIVRGGNKKIGLKKARYANIADPTSKKLIKSKILKVRDNPANRDYERRGVLTKGCSIETEAGLAKVTSRPGQNGIINALLLK
jgi:small subunit ribosomal protein S8e